MTFPIINLKNTLKGKESFFPQIKTLKNILALITSTDTLLIKKTKEEGLIMLNEEIAPF